MAEDEKPSTTTTTFRWATARRGVSLRRRRVLPSIRLGGKRKGFVLVKAFRRLKLRWLKMQYVRILMKNVKMYYKKLVKELMEGGASYESFQQRLMMETSFAIPVMGVSLASYPSMLGSNR